MNSGAENFRKNSHWITGEFQDILIDRKGNRTVLPVNHNLVVDSCSNLIACLFKDSSVTEDVPTGIQNPDGTNKLFTSAGIRYWGIGGIKAGDSETWPNEFGNTAGTDRELKKEFYRAVILPQNIKFVDSNGEETADVTNRIKITVTVPYDEGNGTWYEFGLFGGNSATEELKSGIMINRKAHDPITKNVNLQIQRTIIFTF